MIPDYILFATTNLPYVQHLLYCAHKVIKLLRLNIQISIILQKNIRNTPHIDFILGRQAYNALPPKISASSENNTELISRLSRTEIRRQADLMRRHSHLVEAPNELPELWWRSRSPKSIHRLHHLHPHSKGIEFLLFFSRKVFMNASKQPPYANIHRHRVQL